MMLNNFGEVNKMFLQSAPIEVRMAGFKSNTMKLQSHGWQMSIEARMFAYDAEEIRVAFKHDGIKQVALGRMEFDSRRMIYMLHNPSEMAKYYESVGIEISCIAPMIRCQVMPTQSMGTWQAIDARPQWVNTEALDLADIAMFKPIKSENFEIYIHEKDEQEILEMLLKKQDPKQKEIRQNQKRREYLQGNEGLIISDLGDKLNHDIKHQIVLYGAA